MKSYLLHIRPQSIIVTFCAAFTGYALSPEKPTILVDIIKYLALILLFFSILLWGGTNAYNSGQDGDEGALTLLPNPPPVPKYLSTFGLSLMILAIILSFFISFRLMIWTMFGTLLSIFYSYKNPCFKRGKDIPIIDMLINSFGFGFCSIIYGYTIAAGEISLNIVLIGLGFTFAYLGGMPTSQIFQLDKANKTSINYTSILGVSNVLKIASVFFILHILFLGLAYTDILFLKKHFFALLCWLGWIILVVVSSIHSYWWSKNPYSNAYNRMNRQMIFMMSSQLLWSIYAWISSLK